MPQPTAAALPVRRDLGLAYGSSLVTCLALATVSVAGLSWGVGGPYSVTSPLLQVSLGGDAANLVLGLPALLGSAWLARRGSLIGLLLWPGALFYVLYAYGLYLVGAPFSALFFGYVVLVTLSAWTLIAIVASIDGAEVRARLVRTPARGVGAALVLIAILAYAGLTAATAGALGDPATEPPMRLQWVVDYVVGTPPLLIGGVLLWRHQPLGYVAAPALLLVSALNGLAFAASAVFEGLLAARSTEPAVVAVHVVISGVSFALLAFFVSRAAGRQPIGRPTANSRAASVATR